MLATPVPVTMKRVVTSQLLIWTFQLPRQDQTIYCKWSRWPSSSLKDSRPLKSLLLSSRKSSSSRSSNTCTKTGSHQKPIYSTTSSKWSTILNMTLIPFWSKMTYSKITMLLSLIIYLTNSLSTIHLWLQPVTTFLSLNSTRKSSLSNSSHFSPLLVYTHVSNIQNLLLNLEHFLIIKIKINKIKNKLKINKIKNKIKIIKIKMKVKVKYYSFYKDKLYLNLDTSTKSIINITIMN